MSPALPNLTNLTRLERVLSECTNSLAKLKSKPSITKKGRAG